MNHQASELGIENWEIKSRLVTDLTFSELLYLARFRTEEFMGEVDEPLTKAYAVEKFGSERVAFGLEHELLAESNGNLLLTWQGAEYLEWLVYPVLKVE